MKEFNSNIFHKSKEGLPKWYTGKFFLNILIDPSAIQFARLKNSPLLISRTVRLKSVLDYIKKISTPLEVSVFYPSFLKQKDWKTNEYAFLPEGTKIIENKEEISSDNKHSEETKEVGEFLIAKKDNYFKKITQSGLIEYLKKEDLSQIDITRDAIYLYEKGGLDLLKIYNELKCDFLISTNYILLENKQELFKKYKIWVRDWYEFLVDLEIFLRGHNVFIDVIDPVGGALTYGYDVSTFYPMTNQNLQRYQLLRNAFLRDKNTQKLNEYWRIALYHRYPFLLYSYDQAKANVQLSGRFSEGDRYRGHHYFLTSYFINAFYLMLWGFLDNLAWILNYFYNLGFRETDKSRVQCTFINKRFKKFLFQHNLNIINLIEDKKFTDWFKSLSIKRHPAAHREPIFLSQLLDKNTFQLISDRIVVVEDEEGKKLFDAVNHLEYDLKILSEFMDKFCLIYGIKKFREYYPNL
ncbi:hypothetical protein ES703_67445 [subsurface metagenome]|jgi:hypothetical protein